MQQRARAKLMRLSMSRELGELIRAMPVSVKETTKGDSVYLGRGFLTAGRDRPRVTLRVFLSKDGRTVASVVSKDAGLDFEAPFGTSEERDAFPKNAVRAIVSRMN